MSEPITHSRAFELLPWLVNGSLSAEERSLVEQHVSTCLSCHRELKEQQRLRAAVRAQPAVHISPQTGFEQLTRTLGGEPVLSEPRRAGPLTAFLRFAVVGAAGALLLGALLWLSPSLRGTRDLPAYETLATERGPTRDGDLDVVFVQSITAAEMQALLREIGARIAAGPSNAGRYTIRLDDSKVTAGEIDALLAQLAKDPRVRFAGRALAPVVEP